MSNVAQTAPLMRVSRFIRSVKNELLTPEMIKEPNKIITDRTLDDPGQCGSFKNQDDNIQIYASQERRFESARNQGSSSG